MSGHQKKSPGEAKAQVLTVRLPADTMRRIEVFCRDNDIPIEQFTIDALMEKLGRWKE